VQLDPTTVIRFTDNAFNSSGPAGDVGNYRNNEQTLTWTTASTVPPGTVITITGVPMVANIGTVTAVVDANGSANASGALGLGNNGDQIFAFQGTVTTNQSLTATFPGTVIYGIGWQGISTTVTNWLSTGTPGGTSSYLPSSLASANIFLAGNPNSTGGQYNGPRANMTNAQFKTAVNTVANWSLTGTVATFNTTAFTNTPLYVELTSFTARKEQNKVGLYWNTASEHENAGFDIERSADGKTYQTIGHVATQAIGGNSDGKLSYSFSDETPLVGMNIYRLAQKDKSGKVTYSGTSTVQFDKSSGFVVYPNPVKGQLHVQYASDRDELLNIAFTDVSGKIVLMKQISATKGMNNATIDAAGFAQGVYHMSVYNQQGMMHSARILKD
jgi:hypothetical protein